MKRRGRWTLWRRGCNLLAPARPAAGSRRASPPPSGCASGLSRAMGGAARSRFPAGTRELLAAAPTCEGRSTAMKPCVTYRSCWPTPTWGASLFVQRELSRKREMQGSVLVFLFVCIFVGWSWPGACSSLNCSIICHHIMCTSSFNN